MLTWVHATVHEINSKTKGFKSLSDRGSEPDPDVKSERTEKMLQGRAESVVRFTHRVPGEGVGSAQ